MIQTMRAKPSRLGWLVSCSQAEVQTNGLTMSPGVAARRGRKTLHAWRKRLMQANARESWQAEFPKACLGEGEVAIGYAEALADECAEIGAHRCGTKAVTGPWLSPRSLRLGLRARGQQVALLRWQRWLDRSSFLIAAIVAWCSLLALSLRHTPHSQKAPVEGDWMLAVHGEWSNRTRHVLQLVAGRNPPACILVLGRPQQSLARLQELWSARLEGAELPPLQRPWSLPAVWSSLPACTTATVECLRIASAAPYLPPFRERIAMLWRAFLGEASAIWWRRQPTVASPILYGHTGTADTTLLELAQQAGGCDTLHAVHGISGGLNFTGRSSVAVFRCGHDARWHSELGGYGRCVSDLRPPPTVQAGGAGIVLFSSLAHPMHPGYRALELAEEKAALQLVATAAAELRGDVPLTWKPHPAINGLPEPVRHNLVAFARSLGYAVVAPDSEWREVAGNAAHLVTTASTMVVDLLALGCLPILIASDWIDPDSALAAYPRVVHDVDGLTHLFRLGMASSNDGHAFASAWKQIEPATGLQGMHKLMESFQR